MKVSELSGVQLDWAVAKCEEIEVRQVEGVLVDPLGLQFSPSIDWSYGGMVIERESICIGSGMDAPTWYANKGLGKYHQFGTTPLIAAMRCYVASKLGAEIELPEESK